VLTGIFLEPLLPLGIVLSVVSLATSFRTGNALRRFWAISALVLGLMLALLLGLPGYKHFPERAKQVECKTKPRAALSAERAYFEEHHAYSSSPSELRLEFDRPRYLYLLDRQKPLSEAGIVPGMHTASTTEQTRTCPDCVLTLVCAGNLDEDPVVDV
jgi:hypothetical protein